MAEDTAQKRSWVLPLVVVIAAVALLVLLLLRDASANWGTEDAARVQGLAAIGTLIASLVLAVLTGCYVYLTRQLATASQRQLKEAHGAVTAANEANEISRQAIDAQRDHVNQQLEQSTHALWASTTPLVTVENTAQTVTPVLAGSVIADKKVESTRLDLRLRFVVTNHGPGPAIVILDDPTVGRWILGEYLHLAAGAGALNYRVPTERVVNVGETWEVGWLYQASVNEVHGWNETGMSFIFRSRGTTTPIRDTHQWPLVHPTGLVKQEDGSIQVKDGILAMHRLAVDHRTFEDDA